LSPFNDAGIDRIKAKLLVHVLKASDGGYKLSFDMIKILAIVYEDCIIPGDAQVMAEVLEEVLREYGSPE